jgi:hypothetical protein
MAKSTERVGRDLILYVVSTIGLRPTKQLKKKREETCLICGVWGTSSSAK